MPYVFTATPSDCAALQYYSKGLIFVFVNVTGSAKTEHNSAIQIFKALKYIG